jgi:hypothetical protein
LLTAGYIGRVQAAATLSLYDGVNPLISVADNGPGDVFRTTGVICVQTNVGVWYLSISSAVTKPLFGSATEPVMDLLIQANASGAGTLRFTFSDDDFGPATGALSATVDGHVITGAAATLSSDVYADPGNGVGAQTIQIASTGTLLLPGVATGSGLLGLSAPYSLTQDVLLNASGATMISADASFEVIPEPTAAGLVVLGLAMCANRRRPGNFPPVGR